MKQNSDVTRMNYTSPSVSILKFAEDVVRTSEAQEVGVAWNDAWNDAWNNWGN